MVLAVFLIPVATLLPTLKVAVNGEATAPIKPDPSPLKNPLAPSYLALVIGFVNIPVIPPANSLSPPFTPR